MKIDTLPRAGLLATLLALTACGGSDNDIPLTAASQFAPCATAFAPVASGKDSTLSKTTTLEATTPPGDQSVLLSTCQTDAGRNLTIGPGPGQCGPLVVIDQSFTSEAGNAFGKITIASGGALGVPATINGTRELETAGISVAGTLSIGTAQCPVGKNNPDDRVRITFTGKGTAPPAKVPWTVDEAHAAAGQGSDKGIQVESGGVLRLFGAKGVVPTGGVSWTALALPAGPAAYQGASASTGIAAPVPAGGETTLYLANDVTQGGGGGWRRGDWIVVGTSSFSPFESEFVEIASVERVAGGSVVSLRQALKHYHFGGADPGRPSAANYRATSATNFGVDERSEVGLISRNIVLTAATPKASPSTDDPTLHWGGEIRFTKGFAEASVQGVEMEKFGKARLGSYPIHFHMAGDISRSQQLIDSNSIHHSYNKCVTLHETSHVSITNNVCARAVGHLFYQEMGDVSGASFKGNLGLGAMSNSFGLAPTLPRNGTAVKGYWEGDNLAEVNGYDGLNIPNTGYQQAPSRGKCFLARGDGTIGLVPSRGGKDPDGVDYAAGDTPCDTARKEIYVEQSSGFWLVNPDAVVEANAIGGCQGMGKAYWYVPPADRGSKLYTERFQPLGSFANNRAHACYDGLFGENDVATASQQLFPTVGGKSTADKTSANLISHFRSFTATRIRNRGVWIRPMWTALEDGRFATNRDSVSLVSSGGLDGNGPGVWALLKDSVLVGVSTNNVERWGPCPAIAPGDGLGCVDYNSHANEVFEHGYQTPRWNSAGYMIYDGPVRIIHNHFANYLKNVTPLLTAVDRKTKEDFVAYGDPKIKNYEGDAALGWFQANQSAYPTATVSRGLSFDNVDFRHQIYTEFVNLGPFKDGDKNTAVIDLDGTLTGYKVVDRNGAPVADEFPISLNNLPFNRTANAVDECHATGMQDAQFENRPTSLISPANMATLEFEAQFPLKPEAGNFPKWQDMVFTKDSLDAGVHQSMTLNGRDGQGIWEPKVASGSSYTVKPAPSSAPNFHLPPPATADIAPPTGMPKVVRVGFTDAVKPAMDQKPFYVRLGICYSNTGGGPPTGTFRIRKGYKSWGGNGVNVFNPQVQANFNELWDRRGSQRCKNLDNQNPAGNLDAVNGCPAEGITPVPAGGCPAGSTEDSAARVCVYPRTELQSVSSIDDLTNRADGTPRNTNAFFFDKTTGMLFFYVLQDAKNAHAVAPIGSCPGNDAACPAANELDTYFGCPAQGCINYSVELDDLKYTPGPAQCDALAGGSIYGPNGYSVPEPPAPHLLAYAGEDGSVGEIVKANVHTATGDKGTFTHWTPDREPNCPITTPAGTIVASNSNDKGMPAGAIAAVQVASVDHRSLAQKAYDWLRAGIASLWDDARSSRMAQWLQNSIAAARDTQRREPFDLARWVGGERTLVAFTPPMEICSAQPTVTARARPQVDALRVP